MSTILSLLIVWGITLYLSFRNEQSNARQRQAILARLVADDFSRLLVDAESRLAVFGETVVKARAIDEITTDRLYPFLLSSPLFTEIALFSVEGQVQATAFRFGPSRMPVDLTREQRLFEQVRQEQPHYQDPAALQDPGLGQNQAPRLRIAVPLLEAGELTAILVGDINMYELWDLNRHLDEVTESRSLVLTGEGRVISAADTQLIARQPAVADTLLFQSDVTVGDYTSALGDEVVGARAQVEPTGWAVVLERPAAVIYQGVYNLTLNLLIVIGGAVPLASLLGWVAGKRIAHPVQQLHGAVEQFGQDPSRYQPVHINTGDELTALGDAFNSMMQRLQHSKQELEQANQELAGLLTERTDALERAEELGAAEASSRRQLETAIRETEELRQIERKGRERLEETVNTYLRFVQHVARGDLSQRLTIQETDALGQLGQGLNEMVENLQLLTIEVRHASENIIGAAAKILSSTTQQASSTSTQSDAITGSYTLIEEIRTIALQTAQQAAEVARESRSMLQIAQHGIATVDSVVVGMEEIQQRVNSIQESILALSNQTRAISQINHSVNELAEQSNLLALNAAIEAARAGSAGTSFAVVADHIRGLAQRSKTSTGEIRKILEEIQRGATTAVVVTEEGTREVELGGTRVEQAGAVIHQIAQEVEKGVQANTQMAMAAQQQMIGVGQIGDAIAAIRQETSQLLASTRQAEAAAQDLHSLAKVLQGVIAKYRL